MSNLTLKRRRKLPPSTAIVTQSNDLVSARYALPLGEMRLLFTVISKIQPTDTRLTVYHIPVREFAEFLGVDKNSAYREVKKVTKALVTRYVEIKEPNKLTQTTWIASAEYVDGTGVVDIRLNDVMIPHLLQLKNGNFTQCKLTMLLSFKSQYTLRLYMLLKQKRDHNPYAKAYEFELGELRKMLGVSIEAIPRRDKFDKAQEAVELYPEYKHFKASILEAAKKELTTKADFSFEYEEIRHGRRVTALIYGHDWEIEQQQASKAAEQAQKTVALQELNALADDIRALQRNLLLVDSAELRQQVEHLKAEYARKREIYDAENSEEEETEA